jgi:hypothetical protein
MKTGIDIGAISIRSCNSTTEGWFKTNPNDSTSLCSHIKITDRSKCGSWRKGSDNRILPLDGRIPLIKSIVSFSFIADLSKRTYAIFILFFR